MTRLRIQQVGQKSNRHYTSWNRRLPSSPHVLPLLDPSSSRSSTSLQEPPRPRVWHQSPLHLPLQRRQFGFLATSPPRTYSEKVEQLRESTSMIITEKHSVGSFTAVMWQEAVQAIFRWTSIPTVEAVNSTLLLLERLIQEQQEGGVETDKNYQPSSDNNLLNTVLLHSIVANWHDCYAEQKQNQKRHHQPPAAATSYYLLLNPMQLLQKLDHYREQIPTLQPDVVTYGKLMDGAAKYGVSGMSPDQTAHFVQSIFDRLQKESPDRINPVTFGLLIMAYSRAGKALEAEKVLTQMYNHQLLTSNDGGHHSAGNLYGKLTATTALESLTTTATTMDEEDEYYRYHAPHKPRHQQLEPGIQPLNLVLHAWSKSNHPQAPERVESIFRKMTAMPESTNIRPDLASYNAVMNCWARSGRKASGERVEAILEEMNDPARSTVKPDTISISIAINAWARLGDAKRAEALLLRMYDEYLEGNKSVLPNVKSYTAVLHAWSQSRDPSAPERAHAIMEHMKRFSERGHPNIRPNVVSYCSLLNAWARSGRRKEAGEQAEAILKEMKDQQDDKVAPNTVAYNTVIHAWAQAGNPKRAEALLKEMYHEFLEGNDRVEPSIESFNSVLHAWAQKGSDPKAPEKAERILEHMKQHHTSGTLPGVQPNVISYSILLNSWAKRSSQRPDAPQKAEALLEEMEEAYQNGDHSMQPNTITYNTVIQAWAERGEGERAEEFFTRMHREYEKGNHRLKPDVKTFNGILKAWSRGAKGQTNKDGGAPERAEKILKHMWEVSASSSPKSKNNSNSDLRAVHPNTISYNLLLNTWVNSGRPDATKRAEAILADMERLSSRDTESKKGESSATGIQPDTVSYNTVINALAKAGDAPRAEALMHQMNKRALKGNPRLKPDVFTFSTVLNAWSRSQHGNAPERAEEILKLMRDDIEPNVRSYTAVINCWAKSGRREGAVRAQELLQEMLTRGIQPSGHTYSILIYALENCGSLAGAEALLVQLCEQYHQNKRDKKKGIIKPELPMFISVLRALSRSSESDVPERAEATIAMMLAMQLEPNTVIYNALMSCWVNSGRPNAGERVESIFEQMEEQSRTRRDNSCRPDTITYNTIMNAWGKAGNLAQAESWFNRMYEAYQNLDNAKVIKPNTRSFTTIIDACSRSSDPAAPEKAREILDFMRQDSMRLGIRPNAITYSAALRCWANSKRTDAGESAEDLLKEMEEQAKGGDPSVKPNEVFYNNVASIWRKAGNEARADDVLERMQKELLTR